MPKGPIDTYYIQNSITDIKGAEKLKPYCLREPHPEMGGSTFAVATCCSTIMCVDHPFYEEKWVLVMANVCKLNTGDVSSKFQTN